MDFFTENAAEHTLLFSTHRYAYPAAAENQDPLLAIQPDRTTPAAGTCAAVAGAAGQLPPADLHRTVLSMRLWIQYPHPRADGHQL